jgi:hypothetical protein
VGVGGRNRRECVRQERRCWRNRHERRDATDEINHEGENHVQKGQTGSKAGENTTRGVCVRDCGDGRKESVV